MVGRRSLVLILALAGVVCLFGILYGALVREMASQEVFLVIQEGDDAARIRSLLTQGAQLEQRDESGIYTPLMLAAVLGRTKIVGELVARGAALNATSEGVGTALVSAAEGGQEEIVHLLVSRGADPDAQGELGRTALMLAALNGHSRIVKALLAAGARTDVRDRDGECALGYAAHGGHMKIALLLVTRQGTVKQEDLDHALQAAAEMGRTDTVRQLLEQGADVNARGRHDEPPVYWAAVNGHSDVVRILLRHGSSRPW